MTGRFMAIEQAIALPRSCFASVAYLHGFVETTRASGFIAVPLARSGQGEATVAPAV